MSEPNHVENNALEAINKQLKMLVEAHDSSRGYLEVVSSSSKKENTC